MGKGWPEVKLGEVLSQVRREETVQPDCEYAVLGAHWYAHGLYTKAIKPGSSIKATKAYRVEEGDFVYNRLFAWKGSFAVASNANAGCYVSNEFPCFDVARDRLEPRFLWHYFRREAAWNEALGLSHGATPTSRNRLKEARLLAMKIPLPPLSEQRRIVAKIDRLAEKIEEARGLREKSGSDLDAVFAAACRTRFSADSWKLSKLEELVGRNNLRNGKSLKATDSHSKVRCLRLSAMSGAVIDTDDAKPIPMTPMEATPYLLRANAAYVVRGNGSKNLVGRAAIAERDAASTIFPDLLISVPLEGTGLLPQFFVTYWNSPEMRRRIQDAAKTTSGIWKINQGHVASFSVPIPPASEQRRIVAYLDNLQAKVDAIKKLQEQTAAELDALLPSILDQAFKGEL